MPMLDEIREYSEYTNVQETRLTKTDIKDKTYGRALNIIARQCIFGKLNHVQENEITDEIINETKKELDGWLKSTLPEIIGHLEKDENKAQKYKKIIPNLEKNNNRKPSKNDINELTYETIMADALDIGPLRRYYLAAENIEITSDIDMRCLFEKLKIDAPGQLKKKKVLNSTLKILSAYLLTIIEGNEWSNVKQSDLDRWKVSKQFWGEYAPNIKYNGDELIKKDNFLGNNMKIYVNPQWIKECGWCLADENGINDKLENNPEMLYYSDQGTDDLSQNTKYNDQ